MARKLRLQYAGYLQTPAKRPEWLRVDRLLGELGRRRWSEADLPQRRKTDAKKVHIAVRPRRAKVQTLGWIAKRLPKGGRHTLANCLKANTNHH